MRFLAICSVLLLSISIYGQELYFPPNGSDDWQQTSPEDLGWCQDNIEELYSFLEENSTKSFILLKDGKIVLEQYFDGHEASTPWYWASAGKGITAFMVGIAQQEGHLSLTDRSSDYLGAGWTSCTVEQEGAISIWNQVTMTSGLDDQTGDPFCTDPECLIYKADPGDRWAYHNGPYTSLDGVIEGATGLTLNQYTNAKLKQTTGMTGSFIGVDFNNVFFSTARSMARFGLLMLAKGQWDGASIMTDEDYFTQMVSPSQELNPSYGYLWWLNGQSAYMLPGIEAQIPGPLFANAPADAYMALGKNGQFLNIVPSQGLVWLRMGDFPEESPVPHLLNDDIWKLVNQLTCGSVAATDIDRDAISLYPNPVSDRLYVTSDVEVANVTVFSATGRVVLPIQQLDDENALSLEGMPAGVYFVSITLSNGQGIREKILKP